MEVKDIKLDDYFDLVIENGDFKVSSSDMQHIPLFVVTILSLSNIIKLFIISPFLNLFCLIYSPYLS